ncbi:helix-turn-helix transcriptional regulator [Microbacterium sp. M1A1_1b]
MLALELALAAERLAGCARVLCPRMSAFGAVRVAESTAERARGWGQAVHGSIMPDHVVGPGCPFERRRESPSDVHEFMSEVIRPGMISYQEAPVVQRTSARRRRQLAALGENVRRWRAINGMSAAELADRAAVSRQTLRAIEAGEGGRIDSLFAVLGALGIADAAVAGIDPYNNEAARARIDDMLRLGKTL